MYFESGHFEVMNGVIFVSKPEVIEKVEQETLQPPYITDMPRNDLLSIIFSIDPKSGFQTIISFKNLIKLDMFTMYTFIPFKW